MKDRPKPAASQYQYCQPLVKPTLNTARNVERPPRDAPLVDRFTIYPGWQAMMTKVALGRGIGYELIVRGAISLEPWFLQGTHLSGDAIGYVDQRGVYFRYLGNEGLHAAASGMRLSAEIPLVPFESTRSHTRRFRFMAIGTPVVVWFIPPWKYEVTGKFDVVLKRV